MSELFLVWQKQDRQLELICHARSAAKPDLSSTFSLCMNWHEGWKENTAHGLPESLLYARCSPLGPHVSVWFTHLCGPASASQQVLLWCRVAVGTVCVYLNNSGVCVCARVCMRVCVCVCFKWVGWLGWSVLRDDIIRVLAKKLPTEFKSCSFLT